MMDVPTQAGISANLKALKQLFGPRRALLFFSIVLSLGLVAGCGGSGSAPLQVTTSSALSIVPSSASLNLPGSQRFQASGPVGSGTLTWSVNGVAGGNAQVGTITPDGFNGATYTPPAALPSSSTVTITVSSSASSVTAGKATVTLACGAPTIHALSPDYAFVGSGDTQVSVTGVCFSSSTALQVNGAAVATTINGPNSLTATVPSASLSAPAELTMIAATSGVSGTSGPLNFTVLNPGQVTATQNPLVANYSITLPRDAKVKVEFGPDTNYGLQTWTRPTPTGGGTVNIYVAGMRASTTYHMRADVTFPDGTTYQDPDLTFGTGAVDPTLVPQVTVTQPGPLTPSPGVELMDLLSGGHGIAYGNVVFDLQGNLIWYYPIDLSVGGSLPIKLLPNGDFMAILIGTFYGVPGNSVLREFDLAGNTVREITQDQLGTELTAAGYNLAPVGISHDFVLLPNGHVVVIVTHTETISNLVGYTGPVQVIGDALVELDQNFKPVWVWDTFDHLDVNRHPFGFGTRAPYDWTHCNAVAYSKDDGDLLLSSRHQSWIMKIDYQDGKGSGNILWRLGYQGDFTMASGAPAAWQYGQHYIFFPQGTTSGDFELETFDDGNNRVMDANGDICGTTGQPACYSRGVIFNVNEATKTASVAWEDILPFYSQFLGSMQQLPNGDEEVGEPYTSQNPLMSGALEVTRENPPQTVWQMTVNNLYTYRGLRLPSLYPGVQW